MQTEVTSVSNSQKQQPRTLAVDPVLIEGMMTYLRQNPLEMLHVPTCMNAIVKHRFQSSTQQMKVVDEKAHANVKKNTIHKNLTNLSRGVGFLRPALLYRALLTVDAVRKKVGEAQLLSVGPRSEAELFLALTHGFSGSNIMGLDLMSYSDWVDVGDAHEMPYPDHQFDVVTIGWVLAYSQRPERILTESIRVLRPGGYLALGCQHVPSEQSEHHKVYDRPVQTRSYATVDEVMALFQEPKPKLLIGTEPDSKEVVGDVIVVVRTPS